MKMLYFDYTFINVARSGASSGAVLSENIHIFSWYLFVYDPFWALL